MRMLDIYNNNNQNCADYLFTKIHHNYDIMHNIISYLFATDYYNNGIWLCTHCGKRSSNQLKELSQIVNYGYYLHRLIACENVEYDIKFFRTLLCNECKCMITSSYNMINIMVHTDEELWDIKKYVCFIIKCKITNQMKKYLAILYCIRFILCILFFTCSFVLMSNIFIYLDNRAKKNIKNINMRSIYILLIIIIIECIFLIMTFAINKNIYRGKFLL